MNICIIYICTLLFTSSGMLCWLVMSYRHFEGSQCLLLQCKVFKEQFRTAWPSRSMRCKAPETSETIYRTTHHNTPKHRCEKFQISTWICPCSIGTGQRQHKQFQQSWASLKDLPHHLGDPDVPWDWRCAMTGPNYQYYGWTRKKIEPAEVRPWGGHVNAGCPTWNSTVTANRLVWVLIVQCCNNCWRYQNCIHYVPNYGTWLFQKSGRVKAKGKDHPRRDHEGPEG
jgi:hypothetical protein